MQRLVVRPRNIRIVGQCGVRSVIARKRGDLCADTFRGRMKRLQQIVEIARPAERPDDDQLRMPQRPLDIGIDGHRMPEAHQAREPQRRPGPPFSR